MANWLPWKSQEMMIMKEKLRIMRNLDLAQDEVELSVLLGFLVRVEILFLKDCVNYGSNSL